MSCSIGSAILLRRPVRRPPHELRRYFASFTYQAQSWKNPGASPPRSSGIPASRTARRLHRDQPGAADRARRRLPQPRGTAEQWIREGEGAIKWTWLSCRAFAANAVRSQLHVLAYNLANFMRTLAMPKAAEPWSLTSLREKLIRLARR
jgi:hypothetical protein